NRLPDERARVGQSQVALAHALEGLEARETALRMTLQLAPDGSLPGWGTAEHRVILHGAVIAWQQAQRGFKAWCLYNQAANWVAAQGLQPLGDAHRQGRLAAADVPAAFERNLLTRWTAAVRDTEPALLAFDSGHHDRQIAKFVDLDADYIQLARQWGISALEQRLPTPEAPVAESSERGTLVRQGQRKVGHMPVRKLLQAIPDLALRLKPCFMMSPLSIAQYLPADWRQFDVVIFDEASQIGTHDAIGAIARGRQVIIVGDSQQLPPTIFFQRQDADDGTLPDENDLVELESILDEATAKQIAEQTLGWHYRSRHDSLIEFSNRHYYMGKLHVFPAAQRVVAGLGLAWHPVPAGGYQRSGQGSMKATNPQEAEALVAHLVQRLRANPVGSRTFGVVTFSMAQQHLVMDLLDEQRVRFPEIEGHFAGSEAVFVKNLENVQGDERDEIYFSICYGKDAHGHLLLNFGPLNRRGGERRLNVAITRARCQLRVFSALTWDQIDLSRSSAIGVAHLRSFLQFVSQQGQTALDAARERRPGNDLERDIRAELLAMGYDVHANVGSGQYRIDLAVVDPATPGTYLLGIETDGTAYGHAANARDRERLRHQVLHGLGWHVHHIWAMAWWQDPGYEKQRLRDAVVTAQAASQESFDSLPPPMALSDETEPACAGPVAVVQPDAPAGRDAGAFHRTYDVQVLPQWAQDPEAFYGTALLGTLQGAISQVVATEGPIHVDLLCRRLMPAFGLGRLTDRIRRRVLEAGRPLIGHGGLQLADDILWPVGVIPAQWAGFRGAAADGTWRDAEHLPPAEVAQAACWILSGNLAMSQEDLLREVGRCFGIQRAGKQASAFLGLGLRHLERQGRCQIDGGRVRWLDPGPTP
ncbi:MAG: DUF3320 domain-containing protein, partial [Candidatus Sericytochromatia bacterium]|nr:DUF3320 domain-containing protein [Candidatus Sericytochromatia bacterium]